MAGRVYDIRSKITNELPVLQITDDLIVTVNNRKSVVLSVQAMSKEVERKQGIEQNEDSEIEFMNKTLGMLIGEKNVKAINDMDLPLPEYKEVFQSILSLATSGELVETP